MDPPAPQDFDWYVGVDDDKEDDKDKEDIGV